MHCGVFVVLALFLPSAHAAFGDVYTWGRGEEGALGQGDKLAQSRPTSVSALIGKNTKLVDAGSTSSTAVTTDGQIFMWGQGINAEGELGLGLSSEAPVMVKGLEGVKVVQFTVGTCHYSVLTNHGEVMTWGCNTRGALGRGRICPTCHSTTPQKVGSLQGRNIRQLVSGGEHTAALTDNGEVWVWGSGESGEIGNGLFSDQAAPQRVNALKDVRICQICAGNDHMAAVDTEGAVYTWGSNEQGQLGHGLNEFRIASPKKVQRFKYPDTASIVGCGSGYSSVITRSNKVFLWGAGGEPLPTEKTFFSTRSMYPRAVSAGMNHVVVVTKSHEVYTWGSNYQGQLGIGSDHIFTLEPQLVEELLGKHINMIVAGTNHTVALAGQPLPIMCPVFQDWYGKPESNFANFVAECHIDDETCPDGSCCHSGESCAQFDNGLWGCCIGANMRIVEDQLTCCPKEATFNSVDKTCEQPVSYGEAVRLLTAYEDGKLTKLPKVPGETLEDAIDSQAGTPIAIVSTGDQRSSVSRLSESTYSREGVAAANDAALGEYHKITREYAHAQGDAARILAASAPTAQGASTSSSTASASTPGSEAASAASTSSGSAPAAAGTSTSSGSAPAAPSSTSTFSAPADSAVTSGGGEEVEEEEEDEPASTPEDDIIRQKLLEDMSNAASMSQEHKSDVYSMSRLDIVQELKKIELAKVKAGQPENLHFDMKLALMTDDQLRSLLIESRRLAPTPNPLAKSKGDVLDEDGVAVVLPSNDQILREERKYAANAPSIEDIDEKVIRKRVEPEVEDPVRTSEWKKNVQISEKYAGATRHNDLAKLNVLAPESPPEREDPDVIPGASNVHHTPSKSALLLQTQADEHRVGSGPCPRNAGNLDCNRDCSEVDANVIDAARQGVDASSIAAAPAVGTLWKTTEQMLSTTPSASPSPSSSWASNTIVQGKHTFIQEGNTTIAVDAAVVHIPPAGFYRDSATNQTFKIIGDKVVLASPGAKFASMGLTPGSQHKGHCGVSRPTCPDNSCCEGSETCCQQQDGSYGCCPFETGTCCVDQRHCCPEPYSCDILQQACVFNGTTIGMAKFGRVDQGLCEVGKHACKDGSCCEGGHSCCQMFDGLQGCAPYADATCCSDGLHTCPDGNTCDLRDNVCVDILTGLTGPLGVAVHSSVPAGVHLTCAVDELTCDGGACCTSENTCCAGTDGYESCCPHVDGVCCGSGLCCPNAYTCDVANGMCLGPDGNTEVKPVMPGRTPFMLSNTCSAEEISCSGTNLCCAKGEGCCSGVVSVHDKPQVVHGCCAFGEDAVCCDDGTCCPFRHTCDLDMCVDPTGLMIPKQSVKIARPSDVSDTLSCEDTQKLQEHTRELMAAHAHEVVVQNHVNSQNAANLTAANLTEAEFKACPPFCGNDNLSQDTGIWANEEANAIILGKAGESGVHVQVTPDTYYTMEKEREKIEILDLLALLKKLLAQLMASKAVEVVAVRGRISFPCEWNSEFRTAHSHVIRQAIAEGAEVDAEQVVLISLKPSVVIEFAIDPSPITEAQANMIVQRLIVSLQNGDFVASLVSQGLTCATMVEIDELPYIFHEPSLDIASKLTALERLEQLIKQMHMPVVPGEIQLPVDLIASVQAIQTLTISLKALRKEIAMSELPELEQTDNLVARLEELITLLLNYLRTSDDAKNSATVQALLYNSQTNTVSLWDAIKKARQEARCARRLPNEPPGPGCESTQMPLAAMPLRENDADRFDPVLQRQLGSLARAPPGDQEALTQNPPELPILEHTPYAQADQGEFWMPEKDCDDQAK